MKYAVKKKRLNDNNDVNDANDANAASVSKACVEGYQLCQSDDF